MIRSVSLVCLLCLLLGWARAGMGADRMSSRASGIRANDRYVVYSTDPLQIEVFDVQRKKGASVALSQPIEQIEVCPTHPFASVIVKPQTEGALRRYFILDLEAMRLFADSSSLEPGEMRWSPSGAFTYFNNKQSLAIVETSKLREYMDPAKRRKPAVELEGHPLGLTWQVAWLGDRILYGTGIESMVCWGIYDLQQKTNGFIACCGEDKDDACDQGQIGDDEVVMRFIVAAEKNEIKPMANGLFRFVLEREGLKRTGK